MAVVPDWIGHWVGRSRLPYTIFIGLLLFVTATAGAANRFWAITGIAALAIDAAWLNDVVRADRATPAYGGAKARAVLAMAQLVAGLAIARWGLGVLGREAAWYFFLGVALAILSVAALLSELRHWQLAHRYAPWLLDGALAAALVAAVPGDRPRWWLIGLAALAALIGTQLATERSHDTIHSRPATSIMWIVGVVLLASAFGALIYSDVDARTAGLLIGALVVLVLLASSDADGLLLVILAGSALVWAAAPRNAPVRQTEDHYPSVGSSDYYLVLGDSYISGEGAQRFYPGTNTTTASPDGSHENQCRRAPTAWPMLLADGQTDGVPTQVLFLGCSGAVAENIDTAPRMVNGHQEGPAELAQFAQVKRDRNLGDPKFVVVSIGGNNAGFGTIGPTCIGPGDCTEVANQFLLDRTDPVDATQADLAHLAPHIDAAYARIRAALPGVPVIAVPYPTPIATAEQCSGVLLTDRERAFLDGFVGQLDAVVAAEANKNGFFYMDTMERALLKSDRALCGPASAPPGLNFVAFNPKGGTVRDALQPANWTHDSLHPNELGHVAMRVAAAAWLRAHPDLASTQPAPDPTATVTVADIDALVHRAPIAQCRPTDATACDVNGGGWASRQEQSLYRRALFPSLLALVGAWLFVAPLLWFARDRELSVAKLVRCALAKPPDAA